MQSQKTRVRFAPSPTGLLHVGNARTALYNWLFARHTGGDFLLRIEDTDLDRSEARHETQLMEDLRWLGLDWDEGPGVEGPHAPYRQSERLGIYREHTERLLREGKAYRCFCTPEELDQVRMSQLHGLVQSLTFGQMHQPSVPFKYPGTCRKIDPEQSTQRAANGENFIVRLSPPEGLLKFTDIVRGEIVFPPDAAADIVLVRRTGIPVYNYVVTVDDALMEITHVIRGDDHLSNTPKQVAIYEAFGWRVPEFAHLSTILGSDRERLSKRHGATSIASFREMGILPEALVNYLALLGWGAEGGTRETFTQDELTREFKLERVTASPAVFDWAKLHWLNRHYLKEKMDYDPDELAGLAWEFFSKANLLPKGNAEVYGWFLRLLDAFINGTDQLDQLPAKSDFIFHFDPVAARANEENAAILGTEASQKVLAAFAAKVSAASGSVSPEQFKAWMNEVKAETGAKGKDLFHPVRIALTGTHSGPEFDKLIPVIEAGSRLDLPVHVLSVRERVEQFVRL